jgi:hypothetical protein
LTHRWLTCLVYGVLTWTERSVAASSTRFGDAAATPQICRLIAELAQNAATWTKHAEPELKLTTEDARHTAQLVRRISVWLAPESSGPVHGQSRSRARLAVLRHFLALRLVVRRLVWTRFGDAICGMAEDMQANQWELAQT